MKWLPSPSAELKVMVPRWMVAFSRAIASPKPLPSPAQMATIRLNIQSKFLQAEWAALHQQNKIYRESLDHVVSWIARYFKLNTQATTEMLQQLKKLQIP